MEKICDQKSVSQIIDKISLDIVRNTENISNAALVGICTRGFPLARRLAVAIYNKTQVLVPVGALDVTFYRDDIQECGGRSHAHVTQIDFDITGRDLILVDDVLFSGRTVRAALNALADLGRPGSVSLMVLVDRGHRELPLQADYVGCVLDTDYDDQVRVRLTEVDDEDAVLWDRQKK